MHFLQQAPVSGIYSLLKFIYNIKIDISLGKTRTSANTFSATNSALFFFEECFLCMYIISVVQELWCPPCYTQNCDSLEGEQKEKWDKTHHRGRRDIRIRDGSTKGKENAPGATVPEQLLCATRAALGGRRMACVPEEGKEESTEPKGGKVYPMAQDVGQDPPSHGEPAAKGQECSAEFC